MTKLIRGKTCPVSGLTSIDIMGNDLLLVRKKENKYRIQVMHRLTGEIVNQIPSMCNHDSVFLRKYPQHQDTVFGYCLSVRKGSKIVRMCDSNDRSLLVVDGSDPGLSKISKLELDETQDGAQLVFIQYIPERT